MQRLLILYVFLPLTAEAADVPLSMLGRYTLNCPVCRQDFTSVTCVQTNTRGGVDRDLFARSIGPQPEFYRVSTCPRCGYSGYDADFDSGVSLPPDVLDKIRREPKLKLPDDFTPQSDPRELGASKRYELAVTCYRWRQKSDEALAWLCIRASWIAREEGSILPRDNRLAKVMAFIERWRPTMNPTDNQVDVEMQLAARVAEAIIIGQFNRYQKPYVELALALILRRHGENRQAGPMLERLSDYNGMSVELREGIRRMKQSIADERKQQLQAADAFERALLADQIAPANRGPACYLLAELYRRLGRDGEAATWYDKTLHNAALPQDMRSWAKQQRAWAETK